MQTTPPHLLKPHPVKNLSLRQPSPHRIPGCPVVMFFNYVSLFNVAAAHPHLVNRCNFSCRSEMQLSHAGTKGQIEPPQAGGEREIYIYFFILSGYICNFNCKKKGRFSACQATFKENRRCDNFSTLWDIFYLVATASP